MSRTALAIKYYITKSVTDQVNILVIKGISDIEARAKCNNRPDRLKQAKFIVV